MVAFEPTLGEVLLHKHSATELGAILDSRYVNVSGDTMTGQLVFSGTYTTTNSGVDAFLLFNGVTVDVSGFISGAYAQYVSATLYPHGTVNFAAGWTHNLTIQADSGKTIDTVQAIYIPDISKTGTGTITVAAGIETSRPTIGGTTNIGLSIGSSSLATGNYALFSTESAQSYFAGNLGIGVATATVKLDVLGDTKLNGALTINDSAANKDMRVEGQSDANMFFLDASTNMIGIGTSTPGARIDITNSLIPNIDSSTEYIQFRSNTLTIQSVDGETAPNERVNQFIAPTIDITEEGSSTTVTNAATLYIDAAPVAGANVTITNPYALWVDSGSVRLDGNLSIAGDVSFGEVAHYDSEVDNGNSGTADTIDWGVGNAQKSTLNDNCTYTFSAPPGPAHLTLRIVHSGASRNPAWPASVKWAGGAEPTWSSSDGDVDIATFYFDGTDYYGAANTGFA